MKRSKADRTSVKNKELTFSWAGQKMHHSWITELTEFARKKSRHKKPENSMNICVGAFLKKKTIVKNFNTQNVYRIKGLATELQQPSTQGQFSLIIYMSASQKPQRNLFSNVPTFFTDSIFRQIHTTVVSTRLTFLKATYK